jgi:tetratricopeptide (TPR) repeat protein
MMPDRERTEGEEAIEAWAAAYHDYVTAGHGATPPEAPSNPELLPQVQRIKRALDLLARASPLPRAPAAHEETSGTPDRIGRFQIVARQGQGGFGLVFRAIDPQLGREVALKVPYASTLLDTEARRRFCREAETAARLEHSHIVPVYEAGEAGAVLYIVMEFCPGPSLAAWLAARKEPAPPREAAATLLILVEAARYLHSREIIHRDLKPHNVLLFPPGPASPDGPPDTARELGYFVPKVADFGLAKVLQKAGEETRAGTVLGTAKYMAPEQVEGNPQGVSWHTDVYALGAILYELLTLRAPFEGDSDAQIRDRVRNSEPARPSDLAAGIDRDLETICLKCLEKDPLQRYPSAEALGEDLEHWLAGEPIRARRATTLERTVKWVRRRPAAAALIAVSVLAVFAITWLYISSLHKDLALLAKQREVEAERQDKIAARRLGRETIRQTWTTVSLARRSGRKDLETLERVVLTQAVKSLEELARQPAEEPEALAERGRANLLLALLAIRTGARQEAITHGVQAQGVFDRLVSEHADVPDYREDQGTALTNLANFYLLAGQPEKSHLAYTQALGVLKPLVQDYPGEPRYRADLAALHSNLGTLAYQRGQQAAAQTAFEQASSLSRGLVHDNPNEPAYKNQLAVSLLNLGRVHADRLENDRARKAFQEALQLAEAAAASQPGNPDYQATRARCLYYLGDLDAAVGRREPAKASFLAALAIEEPLVRDHPSVTDYALDLGMAYGSMGHLRQYGPNQYVEALGWYARAVSTLETVLQLDPGNGDAKKVLGRAYAGRADALQRLGRQPESVQARERAVELVEEPIRSRERMFLAMALARMGDHERAVQHADALAAAATIPRHEHPAYERATVYALAAAAARKDAKLPPAERENRAEAYVVGSIDLLEKAFAAGVFKNPKLLKELKDDPDFDALRSSKRWGRIKELMEAKTR